MSKQRNLEEVTLAPFFIARSNSGNYVSLKLNAEIINKLRELKEGDKLLFKIVGEDSKRKDSSPDAYLEKL